MFCELFTAHAVQSHHHQNASVFLQIFQILKVWILHVHDHCVIKMIGQPVFDPTSVAKIPNPVAMIQLIRFKNKFETQAVSVQQAAMAVYSRGLPKAAGAPQLQGVLR